MTSGGLGTMGYGLPAVGRRAACASEFAGHRHRRRSLGADDHAGNVDGGAVRAADQDLHPQQPVHGHGAAVAGAAARRALCRIPTPRRCRISSSSPRPITRVGIRCDKPGELDGAIKEMIDVKKPVIFDCVVDPAENCFPMIPSGRAHNEMLLGDAAEEHRGGRHRGRQGDGVGFHRPHPEGAAPSAGGACAHLGSMRGVSKDRAAETAA